MTNLTTVILLLTTCLTAIAQKLPTVAVLSTGGTIASKQDPAEAAQLVVMLASKAAAADGLKQTVLESMARGLKADIAPPWSADLHKAFQSLVASAHPGLPAAALPLISRWDKGNSMAGDLTKLLEQLGRQLQDSSQPDDQRAAIATSLLGVHSLDRNILPSVAKLLGSGVSPTLQRRVIESLGATPDAAVGQYLASAYPSLTPELQELAFAIYSP
jgi:hypothetical protein